jgi:hypothetical protein
MEVAPVSTSTAVLPLSLDQLHARFLAIVPRLRRHGLACFRHLRCLDLREDAIGEMVALSWRWFVRLDEKGKDATRFASMLTAEGS